MVSSDLRLFLMNSGLDAILSFISYLILLSSLLVGQKLQWRLERLHLLEFKQFLWTEVGTMGSETIACGECNTPVGCKSCGLCHHDAEMKAGIQKG